MTRMPNQKPIISSKVSDSGFSLRRNNKVNMLEKLSNKTTILHTHKTSIVQTPSKHNSDIKHEDEKIALVLVLTSAFGICYAFR